MQQAYPLPEHLLAAVTETLRMLFNPGIEEVSVQEKGWKVAGWRVRKPLEGPLVAEHYGLTIKRLPSSTHLPDGLPVENS